MFWCGKLLEVAASQSEDEARQADEWRNNRRQPGEVRNLGQEEF